MGNSEYHFCKKEGLDASLAIDIKGHIVELSLASRGSQSDGSRRNPERSLLFDHLVELHDALHAQTPFNLVAVRHGNDYKPGNRSTPP